YWRCPAPGCVTFGAPGPSQPPPRIRSGRALCPRHDGAMQDAGQRQQSVPVTIWVGGTDRGRFPVGEQPVVVGRSPDDPGGIRLGELLDDEAVQWVSRNHVRLELVNGALVVTDTSTNGTVVRGADPGSELTLTRGQQRVLGDREVVQLHEGVELARADRARLADAPTEAPVMAEAPTIAIRLPGPGA
ncbi:MAG: FHA domain-containing protein, partial [Actinocatenispora sp.]